MTLIMNSLSAPFNYLMRLSRYQAVVLVLGLAIITLSARPASADKSFFRQFTGVGLKGDYYSSSQGSDVSLGIAARSGMLGFLGFGGVGSVNYRFNSHLISGHAGFDAYFLALGLQLALAWRVDRQEGGADLGVNYGLKLKLGSVLHPMFVTIGGQSYTEAPSEFLISYSIFTSLGSQASERRPKPKRRLRRRRRSGSRSGSKPSYRSKP